MGVYGHVPVRVQLRNAAAHEQREQYHRRGAALPAGGHEGLARDLQLKTPVAIRRPALGQGEPVAGGHVEFTALVIGILGREGVVGLAGQEPLAGQPHTVGNNGYVVSQVYIIIENRLYVRLDSPPVAERVVEGEADGAVIISYVNQMVPAADVARRESSRVRRATMELGFCTM